MPSSEQSSPDQSVPLPVIAVDQTYLITLSQRLTVAKETAMLRETFQAVMENEPKPRQIILDFGQTTFIDSSAIGALMHILRHAKTCEAELLLWSVHPEVREIFALLDLEDVFQIESKALPIKAEVDPQQQNFVTHASVRSRTKRLTDIAGALVGLGITALVFIPIVIAIQLDNPGPIFFRQTRCGLMGRRFKLWKFRSMVANAEALKAKVANQVEGPMFKNVADPRVTSVGRLLRKTSLDELPQFLNVLWGDMSLVGTRPPTPDELERYDILNWQRLDVKPGMTGEWQVYGRSQVTKFEDVIALDLRYQQRWSLSYDLRLIIKTVLLVFSRNSGTY